MTVVFPSNFVPAEAQRAGFGKMEVIVNHGRVSSHVSSLSKDRKFAASFIPHDLGRHRIDVKFNGEKVPNSPWFIEVSVRLSDGFPGGPKGEPMELYPRGNQHHLVRLSLEVRL